MDWAQPQATIPTLLCGVSGQGREGTLGTHQIHRGARRSLGGTGRGWRWLSGICHHCGTHSHWGFLPRREGDAPVSGAGTWGPLLPLPFLATSQELLCAHIHTCTHTRSHTLTRVLACTPACLPACTTPGKSQPWNTVPETLPTLTVPAVQACEALGAFAHVAPICIHTGAPILARGREASVRHWVASCKKDSGHQRWLELGMGGRGRGGLGSCSAPTAHVEGLTSPLNVSSPETFLAAPHP